jgi:capsid portal protein
MRQRVKRWAKRRKVLGMVDHPTRWMWLVAVGWERVVRVKMGDLVGQTAGNSAAQESEPP